MNVRTNTSIRHKGFLLLAVLALTGLAIVVLRLVRPAPAPVSAYAASPTPTAAAGTLSIVRRAQVERELEIRGRVAPLQETELCFPMAGWIKEVHVTLGQQVQRGDLLVELDVWELESQRVNARYTLEMHQLELSRSLSGPAPGALAVAQAKVERAQAALDRAKLEAAQAISQAEEALAQAQLRDASPAYTVAQVGLERAKTALDEAQVVYDQSLDRPWEEPVILEAIAKQLQEARLDYRLAQARLATAELTVADTELSVRHAQAELARAQARAEQEVAEAEKDLTLAEAELAQLIQPVRDVDLAILQAKVDKARLDLQRIQTRLDSTRIYAPFDGTILSLDVQIGDPVQMYTTIGVLGDPTELQLVGYVLEQDIVGVTAGQSASVILDSHPDARLAARVHQVSAQPVTWQGKRAYPIIVLFEQSDEMPPVLRTGCDVFIDLGAQSDVLTVPHRALYTEGSLTYVDVVEDDTVHRTLVRVGSLSGDQVEILSGLHEGQAVRVR